MRIHIHYSSRPARALIAFPRLPCGKRHQSCSGPLTGRRGYRILSRRRAGGACRLFVTDSSQSRTPMGCACMEPELLLCAAINLTQYLLLLVRGPKELSKRHNCPLALCLRHTVGSTPLRIKGQAPRKASARWPKPARHSSTHHSSPASQFSDRTWTWPCTRSPQSHGATIICLCPSLHTT
jgi:hypothetical protein